MERGEAGARHGEAGARHGAAGARHGAAGARHTGVRLLVTPRARADEITGARDGAIVVRVTATAEGGRANEAVRRLLAKRLRVALGSVELVRGARSRHKLVRVHGMAAAEVERSLLRDGSSGGQPPA